MTFSDIKPFVIIFPLRIKVTLYEFYIKERYVLEFVCFSLHMNEGAPNPLNLYKTCKTSQERHFSVSDMKRLFFEINKMLCAL